LIIFFVPLCKINFLDAFLAKSLIHTHLCSLLRGKEVINFLCQKEKMKKLFEMHLNVLILIQQLLFIPSHSFLAFWVHSNSVSRKKQWWWCYEWIRTYFSLFLCVLHKVGRIMKEAADCST
jgi:hypothetical protein